MYTVYLLQGSCRMVQMVPGPIREKSPLAALKFVCPFNIAETKKIKTDETTKYRSKGYDIVRVLNNDTNKEHFYAVKRA